MSLTFEDRKKVIIETLERDEKVQVRELANELEVSGETIRRDLDRLEKEGVLKKVYGGAVKEKSSRELPFDLKTDIMTNEKQAICKAAADLVEDGDSIIIGHGTTPVGIVRYLANKKNVTVITPSIPVLLSTMEYFEGKVIFIGGEYEANQKFTSGPLSASVLGQLKANKSFVAAGGLSINDGMSDYDLQGAGSSRQMMSRADEAIILADHTKFGKTTFAHICSLTDISMIITDEHCSEEWQNVLRDNEIELIIANVEN
ncbi:transcriptional regulator, deor family protein [Bacillus sp. OxB-1]|uniref:DeoR/GlpR family DNA-binding transcription regulator n=1 Tax=Bacillus sp. (strain OxB-1) TaxID=98228 RepID=UPI000581E752|nr:DeoR/GlpR family DNA-binding transcription regulator [Bacillus sp. OxB-1]BAQ10230.1 transcriptional regulator, deor family protein [Bacillus sp. OxB-1]